MTRPSAALGAALVALVLLAGATGLWATQRSDGPQPGGQAALSAEDYPEIGLGHVHALGVDPADGVLYAASHYGVFRVPVSAGPTRVANRYQDTMGFTVTGPNTFLGSGHPDLRENLPSRLGLIESTDAGGTWRALSLSGGADFHILRAIHDRIYGYDSGSGTFMVSTDRARWDTRSTRAIRDFVVDPRDPETVLASAPDGLLRSTDGARTWNAVSGAPGLVVLAWAGADALYGVSRDGTLHYSTDAGANWTARGRAGGEPEAIAVDTRNDAETIYVAVTDRGITQSNDRGVSFTTRVSGATP